MAFIIPVALAIASAIATVAAVVASVIAAVMAVVTAVISAIAAGIAIAAITIVNGVIAGFVWVSTQIINGVMLVYNSVGPILKTVYSAVSTWSKAIYAGMKAFLEAIHFATILKIHKIAMLASTKYRDMMRRVYGEIAEYSKALGLSADLVNLLLNDARKIVLDVSSMMGRSYDLGQVQFLGEMNKFLGHMGRMGEHYKHFPGDIFTDIANHIERPAMDAKAGFQQNLLTLLDGVVGVADNTVGKVINLRQDLDQAILHLPSSISEKIYDKINPHLESFDNFIEEEYRPVAETITNVLDVLADRTDGHTTELGNLTHSILNPGDLLSNIDHLPELERLRQEAQIGEISTRTQNREMGKINTNISDAYKGISEIFKASLLTLPPVPYHVGEIKGLRYPIGVTPEIYKSWFVGDF